MIPYPVIPGRLRDCENLRFFTSDTRVIVDTILNLKL